MRPSADVRAVKSTVGLLGRRRVRVTKTEAAGRPVVWSRMWQVIGSRCGGGGEGLLMGPGPTRGAGSLMVYLVLRE